MTNTVASRSTSTGRSAERLKADPTYQAFWLLRLVFTVAPNRSAH
ncbi:hypothetical protein V1634_20150 [Plantactinospora veratri]|uniref:Uncharacterized protein n=1 Tax=Plantactinospora veratri TaxID=1436122 RepID=A0ABU7SGT7_9ACTN